MAVDRGVDPDVRLEEAEAEPRKHVLPLVRVRSPIECAHSDIDLVGERLVHVEPEVLALEAVQLFDDARFVCVLEGRVEVCRCTTLAD